MNNIIKNHNNNLLKLTIMIVVAKIKVKIFKNLICEKW